MEEKDQIKEPRKAMEAVERHAAKCGNMEQAQYYAMRMIAWAIADLADATRSSYWPWPQSTGFSYTSPTCICQIDTQGVKWYNPSCPVCQKGT